MAYKDDIGTARTESIPTLGNTVIALDAQDDLGSTSDGSHDLRGKRVRLYATASGIVLLRGDPSGGGHPIPEAPYSKEFFIPAETTTGAESISHTGSDGEVIAIVDFGADFTAS